MAFFWFAHHFNMANSPAMTHIKEVGGMEAYGQVNAFLELLGEVKNEFDVNNKMMMTVLMSRTMIKKLDKAQRFLDLILETDEFFKNSDLTRIADALEKIARELEKANKLKVAEMPTDNHDGIPLKIREIMED